MPMAWYPVPPIGAGRPRRARLVARGRHRRTVMRMRRRTGRITSRRWPPRRQAARRGATGRSAARRWAARRRPSGRWSAPRRPTGRGRAGRLTCRLRENATRRGGETQQRGEEHPPLGSVRLHAVAPDESGRPMQKLGHCHVNSFQAICRQVPTVLARSSGHSHARRLLPYPERLASRCAMAGGRNDGAVVESGHRRTSERVRSWAWRGDLERCICRSLRRVGRCEFSARLLR